jgi:hypothetical protein
MAGMRDTLFPALFAGILAAGAAFGSTPAAAQPQGYFGPGRDGDYQPPAYDRDRIGLDGARSASGGGLYGGPLYDREPYGYRYSGAGADRVRPDRSDMERVGRAQFERGYREGREDERYRLRAQAAHARALGDGPGIVRGAAGDPADDDRDIAALLLAHGRQQRAMQDVRQSLQEARAAMGQNDRARAEAALAQADQKLRMAGPGVGGDRLAAGWVNQAELALERGDQEAARRAVREARQAVRGPVEEAQQAQGQRSANPSGGDNSGSDGGVRPQQGGGRQQGASGPPAR